jgi:exopolyphosphatase/pppGpp-phosphohydrolase
LVRKRSTVGVGYNYMDRAALKRVAEWAPTASPAALIEAGVREDRLATIGIATEIVELIADMLDVSELWLSKLGLREGVLFEQFRHGHSFQGPSKPSAPELELT